MLASQFFGPPGVLRCTRSVRIRHLLLAPPPRIAEREAGAPMGISRCRSWQFNTNRNRSSAASPGVARARSGSRVGHVFRSHLRVFDPPPLSPPLISLAYRSGGLGHLLANEVFSIGQEMGLQKIIARMPADQKGALRIFERLGFRAEALLGDFVIDCEGRTHDLIVMSHDVTGLTV